jgi:hypothetical protein
MNEQDSETLDSLRESSAFDLAVKTATHKGEAWGIVRAHGLSEMDFANRFPVLAKVVQELPNVPD